MEHTALSDLVGRIYDCALDADLWPPVLHEIKDLLTCQHAFLRLDDMVTRRTTIQKYVGIEPRWQQRHGEYAAEVMEILVDVLANGHPIDEPTVASRALTREALDATRYASEWGRPQGLIDYMGLFLLNSPTRMAALELGRNERNGLFTNVEVTLAKSLIPHLRRTITISNALHLATIDRERMAETLDVLSVGVVLADSDSRIVHANRVAEGMLQEGIVLRKVGNRLRAGEGSAAAEVKSAIELAARNEAALGSTGISVSLTAMTDPVVAHVLPLSKGEIRSRIDRDAVAAIFVNPRSNDEARVLALSRAYNLTRGETRVLARVISGQTVADAAEALGIAQSTAKTHLRKIFEKTETSRRTELIHLAYLITPLVL